MDAVGMPIVDLIGKKESIFYVPLYQRKYTWEINKQVKQLWDDLLDFKKFCFTANKEFFLGSLIIKKDSKLISKHILVDGQQRVTTILLLIAALLEASNKKREMDDYVTLLNYLKSDEEKFKLERVNDTDIIRKILLASQNGYLALTEEEKKSNYYQVFSYFVEKIKKENDQEDIFISQFLSRVLQNIKVAVINLDLSEDEYAVFESINSKGKSLNSADLIKNYIAMNLENDNELLSIFENKFITSFNSDDNLVQFYRQMFAIDEGILYGKNGKSLYYRFKDKYENATKEELRCLINEMCNNKVIWDYIHHTKFAFYLHPLMKSNKNNFYAIIHTIIKNNSVIENDSVVIKNKSLVDWSLKYMSSLVVGRTLVSFGRVEGNRTFAKMAHDLQTELSNGIGFKEAFKSEIIDFLSDSSENYRMPKWNEISDIESKKDLYSELKGTLKYILISIEEYLSKGEIQDDIINIEHIFPQDSKKWKQALEESGVSTNVTFDDMKEWLNTIGNLSIVNSKDNSSLSNKVFIEKQKILEEKSYLKINKMLYETDTWTVKEIKERAKKIIDYIDKIWFEGESFTK